MFWNNGSETEESATAKNQNQITQNGKKRQMGNRLDGGSLKKVELYAWKTKILK